LKISKIRHSQTQDSQRQVTLPELPNPALSNLAITPAATLGNSTLVATHLTQNNKNPAFTVAGGKTPSLRIPKIWQVTLPEFLNPALPNCLTYTGGKTPW
jgi:hypothetical protein